MHSQGKKFANDTRDCQTFRSAHCELHVGWSSTALNSQLSLAMHFKRTRVEVVIDQSHFEVMIVPQFSGKLLWILFYPI